MGTRHRVYRNDELVYDFTEPDVGQPPSGGGTPPPSGGGGTPPPSSGYTGPITFDMGFPGEKSPTDLQRMLYRDQPFAIRFQKTANTNTMRIMGAPQWFTGCRFTIDGHPELGERRGAGGGGLLDLDHSGVSNGTVVMIVTLEAGVASGMVAPQLF